MSLFQQPPALPEAAVIIFDENVSPKAVRALGALFRSCYPPHLATTTIQTTQDFKSLHGGADDQWIPALDPERTIVVSADRGRSNHGARLPRVCKEFGVRHVLLSTPVHKLKTFDKICAILAVWNDLNAVRLDSKGARYYLRLRNRQAILISEKLRQDG